jgi:hypothetical protein
MVERTTPRNSAKSYSSRSEVGRKGFVDAGWLASVLDYSWTLKQRVGKALVKVSL